MKLVGSPKEIQIVNHMASSRYFLRNYSLPSSSFPFIKLPSKMETHLWYIVPDEVRSGSLLSQYMELLSPDERDSVSAMKGENQRKNALLARTLVRTTIARYQVNQHIDPSSLKFRKNVHGKPKLDWNRDENYNIHTDLHFNVSHTSSLIACGISATSPIGVDVEEKGRKMKNNVTAFAERFFAEKEVEYLKSISDSQVQQQEFIKLWTLKEAFVKATGKGFSALPFKTFAISISSSETQSEIKIVLPEQLKGSTSKWQFGLLDVAGCHYCAICTEKNTIDDNGLQVAAWKTIPYVLDELISETDQIMTIA